MQMSIDRSDLNERGFSIFGKLRKADRWIADEGRKFRQRLERTKEEKVAP